MIAMPETLAQSEPRERLPRAYREVLMTEELREIGKRAVELSLVPRTPAKLELLRPQELKSLPHTALTADFYETFDQMGLNNTDHKLVVPKVCSRIFRTRIRHVALQLRVPGQIYREREVLLETVRAVTRLKDLPDAFDKFKYQVVYADIPRNTGRNTQELIPLMPEVTPAELVLGPLILED